jgi:hypothetical protein
MRAVVMQGLHQPLALETLDDPTPQAGEVVVKVGRCGICGSDLHMTEDPAYGINKGDVLGHEFAGEVVALGKGAEGLKLGDLVSVIPLKSCGHCASCMSGEVAWCDHFGLQGGGYAEYAVTKPNQCIRLPQSASLADGAIIEPLAVALHGVNMSGMKPGDKVLIDKMIISPRCRPLSISSSSSKPVGTPVTCLPSFCSSVRMVSSNNSRKVDAARASRRCAIAKMRDSASPRVMTGSCRD